MLLITGPAGTGKSHLLSLMREALDESALVLAPTGIAALKVDGQTIHSFFRLPKGVQTPGDDGVSRPMALYRAISTVIIDEISMVRADVLDKIDSILQQAKSSTAPFGGVRLLTFGDLYQLAPVVPREERTILKRLGYAGAHFFESRIARRCEMRVFALERIHRQRERRFVRLLNAIRVGDVSPEMLEFLNRRVFPEAVAEQVGSLVLTTHRWRAEMRNWQHLRALPTREQVYPARVDGRFPSRQRPVPHPLVLRPGARIMFARNDPSRRWFNGSVGTVLECQPKQIVVELGDRRSWCTVKPAQWERFRYSFDAQTGRVERRVIGRFSQLPVSLGWAATIHKSQGLTLERAHLDFSGGVFAAGQAYVALSRSRTLAGLTLEQPIRRSDLISDTRVAEFLQFHLSRQAA
jgi:ATP-dependent exoDNAse (exonuclease V) alpha subunit